MYGCKSCILWPASQTAAASCVFILQVLLPNHDFSSADASAEPGQMLFPVGPADGIDFHKDGQPSKYLPGQILNGLGTITAFTANV